MNETEHRRARVNHAAWCAAHATAIEAMAEALADEQGLHLHLLTPDSYAFIMALATRAVHHARTYYEEVETDVDEKLKDAEDRIEAAADELRVLTSQIPGPAHKIVAAVEHAISTLTADNS